MATVKQSRILTFLTANLFLKLMALGLALMTVGVIRRIISKEDEFEVPIVVRVAPGAAILDQDARTAYITGRGSIEDLRRVDIGLVRVEAKPQFGGTAGTEQVPIGPRDVEGWPRGTGISRVRPDLVTVSFDREIERQVAVGQPETIGEPRIGRAEIDHTPRYVTVRGPESRIRGMTILRTEPIDVTGAVDAFLASLKVLTEGDQGTYEIVPARVTARVNIVTESIARVWTNRPVRAMLDQTRGQRVVLDPAVVDISARGSPEAVAPLTADHIVAFVDCAPLAPGRHAKVAVQLYLPPGVPVSMAAQPNRIAVTVEEPPPRAPEPLAEAPEETIEEEDSHAAEAETER